MAHGWGAMENGWGGPQLAVATPGTLVELAALLPAAGRSRAVRSWSNPLTAPGGTALPFTVLLLCDQDEETEPLRQEIARAVRARR